MKALRNWQSTVIGLVVFACIAIIVVAAFVRSAQGLLPVGIAMVSLVLSLLTFFRSKLFPPNPEVVPGGVGLLTSTLLNGKSAELGDLALVLPIAFNNTGYGDAVIDGLTVKVFDADCQTMLYRPTAEIDLVQFMDRFPDFQERVFGELELYGRAHTANMPCRLGSYSPFPLRA